MPSCDSPEGGLPVAVERVSRTLEVEFGETSLWLLKIS